MMSIPWLVAQSAHGRENLSILAPASPPTESIRYLFILLLAITGAIGLIVEGVLLYSAIRFRTRASHANEPPQVYGSNPIEIAWTAAPALIVFLLILVVIRIEREVRAAPEPKAGDNPLYVTVIGRQWWWEYVYESFNGSKLGFITANELHVPASASGEDGVNRPIYLTLQSADVCHSFWVPRLAGKTDLIPGRTNQMWFRTDLPGLYVGQCAEYCGTQHAHMLLRVYVDSLPEFESWLANEKKPAVDSAEAGAKRGQHVFMIESCRNCHRIRGTPADGTYAPDLTHLASRQTLASGTAFGLSDPKVNDLVDYLMSLR
jgi:cytochrome c oxidase subunit 2